MLIYNYVDSNLGGESKNPLPNQLLLSTDQKERKKERASVCVCVCVGVGVVLLKHSPQNSSSCPLPAPLLCFRLFPLEGSGVDSR